MTAKIVYFIAVVCAICAAVYFGGMHLSQVYIDEVVMSEENVIKRNRAVWRDFSIFVCKNGISTSDTDEIFTWVKERGDVYLSVYSNNYLIISASSVNSQVYAPEDKLTLQEVDGMDIEVYPVAFADGSYRVYTCDTSAQNAVETARLIWLAAAFLIFSVCIIFYTHRLTHRVMRLSRQTEAISRTDLNSPITVEGKDELSDLAADIDGMRHALIDKIDEERQARQANIELLTSISHDIRTPLTVLIGYCELMEKEQSEERIRDYAHAAGAQAAQLNALMDKLFSYFYLYGDRKLEIDMERYDAQLLLEQLLFEKKLMLESEGFSVLLAIDAHGKTIETDAVCLSRVTDNLTSNIIKYADSSYPVVISAAANDGRLELSFENAANERATAAKSTKIGIKSCIKTVDRLGGQMSVSSEEKRFCVMITLPLCEK